MSESQAICSCGTKKQSSASRQVVLTRSVTMSSTCPKVLVCWNMRAKRPSSSSIAKLATYATMQCSGATDATASE